MAKVTQLVNNPGKLHFSMLSCSFMPKMGTKIVTNETQVEWHWIFHVYEKTVNSIFLPFLNGHKFGWLVLIA